MYGKPKILQFVHAVNVPYVVRALYHQVIWKHYLQYEELTLLLYTRRVSLCLLLILTSAGVINDIILITSSLEQHNGCVCTHHEKELKTPWYWDPMLLSKSIAHSPITKEASWPMQLNLNCMKTESHASYWARTLTCIALKLCSIVWRLKGLRLLSPNLLKILLSCLKDRQVSWRANRKHKMSL